MVRTPPSTGFLTRWLPVIIVLAVAAAYANSLDGAFVLDDHRAIERNTRILQTWPPGKLLSGHRPVVDLTFAVNHAIHGLNVRGYHVVNIAIHMLAALTLFGLIRRTLALPRLRERFAGAGDYLAFVVALLWALHPLNTEAVTYLIQRSESLMGLFYLLTLYGVVRGATSARPKLWYGGAVLCCALGMGCKAVILSAPLVVLVFDRSFLSSSWRGAIRSRCGLYGGLCASWLVLLQTRVAQHVLAPPTGAKRAVGFGFKDISPFEYAATQFGVLLRYLHLSLWPRPLCLDYHWPVARTAGAIVPPAIVVLALLALTVWALWRRPSLGFVAASFFLILAPTSTIVPIRDPLFEHRMYLPLAAVVTLVVFAAYAWLRTGALFLGPVPRRSFGFPPPSLTRRGRGRFLGDQRTPLDPPLVREEVAVADHALARGEGRQPTLTETAPGARTLVAPLLRAGGLVGLVAWPLMLGTVARNRDYADELTIWRDVVAKRGDHARAEYNIGTELIDRNENERAIPWLLKATRTDPRLVHAYYNLGKAYARQNRVDDAFAWYAKAIQVDPNMAEALSDLGNLLARAGRSDEAIERYRRAIAAKPRYAPPYFNLSRMWLTKGNGERAVEVLRAGTAANPAEPRLHVALAQALRALGRPNEAVAEYRKALRLDPDNTAARKALEALSRP